MIEIVIFFFWLVEQDAASSPRYDGKTFLSGGCGRCMHGTGPMVGSSGCGGAWCYHKHVNWTTMDNLI
jgi:hypothetical protein